MHVGPQDFTRNVRIQQPDVLTGDLCEVLTPHGYSGVSVLVIAIRSHSYDQLEDQYVNNCNMPESRLSSPVYLQGAKCTIHENKTAN
ncbi:uncharacterized protein [Dendropsophus ebraccatus]|uniref:uncharacterized protein isoform X2 n=1 Tax=Dendropsophus ebraccatus TaxID=150705 RepID=UPI003831AD50